MSSKCELCSQEGPTHEFFLEKPSFEVPSYSLLLCELCEAMMRGEPQEDVSRLEVLSETMWSENIATQVVSFRVLESLSRFSWASELKEQLYLEEKVMAWAESKPLRVLKKDEQRVVAKDSHGEPLEEGDHVTLIKDLDVKGAGFTAKRGTTVKNIRLTDNPEHIEGKVNGVRVVLVTRFLKKLL